LIKNVVEKVRKNACKSTTKR